MSTVVAWDWFLLERGHFWQGFFCAAETPEGKNSDSAEDVLQVVIITTQS